MAQTTPGERRPNRLAGQTSPYLLQHAFNPVDWYAWGEEAFREARRRDVPIFLSVGYSTCYWCHVMERESFEHEETAALLNRLFVPVKVDREARPDIDEVYMAATVLMTGRGGWPMSVFLEPDTLRPFWCGTYFPREERFAGIPTFGRVLDGLSRAYRERREEVREQAQKLAREVGEQLSAPGPTAALGPTHVEQALSALLGMFDAVHGGFGVAPKFPQPVFLEFLLDVRESAGAGARAAIDRCVRVTLDKMACGGICDQLAGGFHRYSVDARWEVPHFEKMLYDNAQLARVYARAAGVFGDSFYGQVAARACEYVVRELTSPDGAFTSAQDAEVDGREGGSYVWRPDEVRAALGEEDADWAIGTFGLDQPSDFRDPHHPEDPPAWVLRLNERPETLAQREGAPLKQFEGRLDRVRAGLFAARMQRAQPRLDDKAIVGWNGLMIGAMAQAARTLGRPDLRAAAERAARFLLEKARDAQADLVRSFRGGPGNAKAFLEDHAALAVGLFALARASAPDAAREWIDAGKRTVDAAISAFHDAATGRFFDTRAGQEDLFVRGRNMHDGATCCGVSMMLHALLDVSELSGEEPYARHAVAAIIAESAAIEQSPAGCVNSVRALFRLLKEGSPFLGLLGAGEGKGKATQTDALSSASVVEVYAAEQRVAVSPSAPTQLQLRVRVAPGYHVVAADPGEGAPGGLTAFRIDVRNGAGVAAYADYPAGRQETVPGPAQGEAGAGVRVFEGEFEVPVVLERVGEWRGQPLLCVRFQACSATECLRPAIVELDVAIDRA